MSQITWKLVWRDEFNGPKIDLANWQLEVGYTGDSNAEMEFYTPRTQNAFLEDGCLVIAALEEDYQGYRYTSARLSTRGLHSWTYGRIEARLKIPFGQGLWPAFWMLGDDIPTAGWPECGEIDIMENIGKLPDTVRGTLHGPGYFRDDGVWSDYILTGQRFGDDFHVFAVEWEPGEIRWYVDNTHYSTITPRDVPGKWVFDHPFFIVLNVAVGGFWPGYPDATTQFPQYMLVDYVRVYSDESKS